jgi:hypothetical protein
MGGVASSQFSQCMYCKTRAYRAPAEVARSIRRAGYCPSCKMQADFEESRRQFEVTQAQLGPPPQYLVDHVQALGLPMLRGMVINSTVRPRQQRVEDALEGEEWE